MSTQTLVVQMANATLLVGGHDKSPCRTPVIHRKIDLYDCDLLINVLECFMMKRIGQNEEFERKHYGVYGHHQLPEPSLFHALEPPSITPIEYLRRLHRYAHCSKSVFVGAFLYLEKIAAIEGVHLRVNSLSVHRLVLTAVLLATKVIDDVLYDNAHFAKVGGLDVKELNMLELDLLKTLQFRLYIEPEEFDAFQARLLDEAMATRDADFVMLPGRLRNLGYDYSTMSKSVVNKPAPASPTSSMDVSFGG